MTAEPVPADLVAQVRRPKPPVFAVPCPHCKAPSGRPCTRRRREVMTQVHASRYDAAGIPTQITQEAS